MRPRYPEVSGDRARRQASVRSPSPDPRQRHHNIETRRVALGPLPTRVCRGASSRTKEVTDTLENEKLSQSPFGQFRDEGAREREQGWLAMAYFRFRFLTEGAPWLVLRDSERAPSSFFALSLSLCASSLPLSRSLCPGALYPSL